MRYPNAYKGVKKMFVAEIINLVAGVLSVVAAVMLVIVAKDVSDVGELYKFLPYVIVLIAAVAAMFVASIVHLIGIINASRDDQNFTTALYLLIAGVVASLSMLFFKSGSLWYGLFESVERIFTSLATVFVMLGLIGFAEKTGDEKVYDFAKRYLSIFIAVNILTIIISLIGSFVGQGDAVVLIEGILAIVAAVLSVAGYVIFLICLGKATKMLKE